MKYIFTTLAVGESYLSNASKCYTEYSEKCSADFNITTNEKCEVGSKVNLDLIKLDKYHDNGVGFTFLLAANCLSVTPSFDKLPSLNSPFVFFVWSNSLFFLPFFFFSTFTFFKVNYLIFFTSFI